MMFAAPVLPARVSPLPASDARVTIRSERCKGCGLCVAICPRQVLALDETMVNVLGYHPVALRNEAACTSCAFCARVCPDVVFTIRTAPRGTPRPA